MYGEPRRSKENTMIREPVAQESSTIKAMGYDEDTFQLEIEFKNGKVYRYDEVPIQVYYSLAMADSIGKAFTKLVKPVYKYSLVEPEPQTVYGHWFESAAFSGFVDHEIYKTRASAEAALPEQRDGWSVKEIVVK